MNRRQPPWKAEGGEAYYARELKPRKPWVRAACWLMSCVLIVCGVMTRYRFLLIFGVLYILTLLMVKEVAVTARGVETFYEMRIATHYECWPWKEIDSVVTEDRKHPELLAVYFGRGDRVKRLFYTREEARKIKVMARKGNAGIKIAET